MGLLFLDVTFRGVVMGSDSQDVLLRESAFEVVKSGSFRKDKILLVGISDFKGLLGYVGTEDIGGTPIRSWLETFLHNHRQLTLSAYCPTMAQQLSQAWKDYGIDTGLWIFISGYEQGDVKFWFVNNIDTQDKHTGLYRGIGSKFKAVNDLDQNYVQPRIAKGEATTKEELLEKYSFHFRNGVIGPFCVIYDAFNEILDRLARTGDPGFTRISTLEKHAFAARQRLEFMKRLYSSKHGLYVNPSAPIGGEVHIYCLNELGEFFRAFKESYTPAGN